MSASAQEREARWAKWLDMHHRDDLVIAAFVHWCGAATLLHENPDLAFIVCSGCHFQLDYPRECQPLYRSPL